MGKLVLTRRAGESVKLVEANGREWLLTVCASKALFGTGYTLLRIHSFANAQMVERRIRPYETYAFAGGSLELRPTKRRWPDQAVLAFDFPRDVKIVRTEIA